MSTLCIVPCGKTKIWDRKPHAGSTEARRVYVGPYATKCRQYAQAFYPGSWCILSAKHGFLLPHDIVPGPYNVTFNDKGTKPVTVAELSVQARQKGLLKIDTVVVVAGKGYVRMAEQVFEGRRILTPLQGCRGIGAMMRTLNEAINRGQPLPDEAQ